MGVWGIWATWSGLDSDLRSVKLKQRTKIHKSEWISWDVSNTVWNNFCIKIIQNPWSRNGLCKARTSATELTEPPIPRTRNTDGHFGMAEAIAILAILEAILVSLPMQLLSISFNIFQYFYPWSSLRPYITLEGSCGSCGSCEMASTFCAPPWRQRILSSITAPTGRNSKASETGNSWPNHNNHGEGMWRTPSKNKTWREKILNSFELYKKWTYLMMLDDVRGIWKSKRGT